MITERHNIYGVLLHTDAMGGAVVLGGVTDTPIDLASVVQGDPTSGEIFPRFKSLITQKPVGRIPTFAIQQALSNIGQLGLKISSATNPGVVVYAQKREKGATHEAGSVHRSHTFGSGIVVPRTLSVGIGGSAVITYDIISLSADGVANPVVIAENVALPSGLDDTERFALGPIKVDDTLLQGVENVEIDFGITVQPEADGPETYDTFVSIDSADPSITITGRNITSVGASGPVQIDGKYITTVTTPTTKVALKRRLKGGQYYADAATEHIVISVPEGMAYPTQLIQGTPRLGTVLRMETCAVVGQNPLLIATGQAIDTF